MSDISLNVQHQIDIQNFYQRFQSLPIFLQQQIIDFTDFLESKHQSPLLSSRAKTIDDCLEKLTSNRTFADISDPVAWQREMRQDRELPY